VKKTSIRPLLFSDISQVVTLHRDVLGTTLNAQIGSKYLFELYLLILKDTNNSAGWVAVSSDGEVIGFLTVTRNLFELEKKIHAEIGIVAKIRAAWYLLRHPSKIMVLISRSKFSRYLRQLPCHQYPTILTIGINHNIQKQGLGTRLIAASDSYFVSYNVLRYFVDTEVINQQAGDFYSRLGFNKFGEYEGNVLFEKEFF